MKKIILFGSCVFLVGLFTSLVNEPNTKQDKIFDQEIEALISSADVKIKDIEDISANSKLSKTNFDGIIFYEE